MRWKEESEWAGWFKGAPKEIGVATVVIYSTARQCYSHICIYVSVVVILFRFRWIGHANDVARNKMEKRMAWEKKMRACSPDLHAHREFFSPSALTLRHPSRGTGREKSQPKEEKKRAAAKDVWGEKRNKFVSDGNETEFCSSKHTGQRAYTRHQTRIAQKGACTHTQKKMSTGPYNNVYRKTRRKRGKRKRKREKLNVISYQWMMGLGGQEKTPP